jgi:CheY-like chemotaxis protein
MKTILIVDDDKHVVDVLSEALATEERVIRRAYDGKGALNWIGKEVFDLVICDLMMPKIHGFQIIEWIKSNSDCVHTKIMVLTAKSFKADADRARREGADLFISKPFEIADLQAKVEKLLG